MTWRERVWPILQSNCGGCHGGENAQMGLDLTAADAYTLLRAASQQNPALKLVDPGRLEQSYLWLKLAGDGSITGSRMPLDPLDGTRTLPPDQLESIQTWILAGALEVE